MKDTHEAGVVLFLFFLVLVMKSGLLIFILLFFFPVRKKKKNAVCVCVSARIGTKCKEELFESSAFPPTQASVRHLSIRVAAQK